MITCGLIAALICRIIETIQSRGSDFEKFAKRRGLTAEELARLQRVAFGFNLIVSIIFISIVIYFIIKLIKNKKRVRSQGYINFLFVVCIIFSIFNIISILFANYIAILSLAINVAIIVGCDLQKNEPEKIE